MKMLTKFSCHTKWSTSRSTAPAKAEWEETSASKRGNLKLLSFPGARKAFCMEQLGDKSWNSVDWTRAMSLDYQTNLNSCKTCTSLHVQAIFSKQSKWLHWQQSQQEPYQQTCHDTPKSIWRFRLIGLRANQLCSEILFIKNFSLIQLLSHLKTINISRFGFFVSRNHDWWPNDDNWHHVLVFVNQFFSKSLTHSVSRRVSLFKKSLMKM